MFRRFVSFGTFGMTGILCCACVFMTLMNGAWALGQTPPPKLDAKKIMSDVNKKYKDQSNLQKIIEINDTTITSAANFADVTVRSKVIIYQKGDKARMEMNDAMMEIPAFQGRPARSEPPYRRNLWVFDGTELKTLFEGYPTPENLNKSSVKATRLNVTKLSQEFQNPITQPEFPEAFLRANVVATEEVFRGKRTYVLKCDQPFQLAPESTILDFKYWIEADDLVIVRIETRMMQKVEGTGAPDSTTYVSQAQDIKTLFGVNIDDSMFKLDLPPDAVDLTEKLFKTKQRR